MGMDKDNRELVNRLFAVATMLLEDAIVPAIAGQSPELTSAAHAKHVRQLQNATTDIAAIVQAVTAVGRFDGHIRRNSRSRPRSKKPGIHRQ